MHRVKRSRAHKFPRIVMLGLQRTKPKVMVGPLIELVITYVFLIISRECHRLLLPPAVARRLNEQREIGGFTVELLSPMEAKIGLGAKTVSLLLLTAFTNAQYMKEKKGATIMVPLIYIKMNFF